MERGGGESSMDGGNQTEVLHSLHERIKELTALHKAVRVMQDPAKSSSEVLQEIVNLLPPAWQYPEMTAARIVFDDEEFMTPNFRATPWVQSAPLQMTAGHRGIIAVTYLEEKPPETEGPFLAEERDLINSLADSVSSYLNRKQAETALRQAHERMQALSQRLMHVQEQERRHLARDLHDEIGQALTAVKMNLQTLHRKNDRPDIAASLSDSMGIVDHILQHVRDLSLDLRPSLLDDLGLVSAVKWYVSRQAERAGWDAQIFAEDSLSHLPADMAVTCYRIVQEAVTNVMRHAEARHLSVTLKKNNAELEIVIRDDGVGFDAVHAQQRAAHGQSLGVLGMEERVRHFDGRLSIRSNPGGGTEVKAMIPLPRESSRKQG